MSVARTLFGSTKYAHQPCACYYDYHINWLVYKSESKSHFFKGYIQNKVLHSNKQKIPIFLQKLSSFSLNDKCCSYFLSNKAHMEVLSNNECKGAKRGACIVVESACIKKDIHYKGELASMQGNRSCQTSFQRQQLLLLLILRHLFCCNYLISLHPSFIFRDFQFFSYIHCVEHD